MIEREDGPARTMGVDQRRLWGHLKHLCVDIGPRLTGTRESEQAQEYIVSHLKRCGAQCETQEYPCPSWEHSSTELTVETAAGPEALPALAQTFSQACDVEAVLAGVGTRVELEYASNLEGKILVLYGEAADAVNADRNVVLLTAEERRAAALIVIDLREQVSSKLIRDPFLQIPAAGVSPSTGITLLKNAGRAARLRIRARRFASTGRNLIGRIRGRTDGLIVLAAHYDTAAGCPGAADNASGTAAILELTRVLAAAEPGRLGVEVVLYDAEEYGRHASLGGNLGSVMYVRYYPGRRPLARAVVEADVVGTRISPPRVWCTKDWPEPEMEAVRRVVGRHAETIVELRERAGAFAIPEVPGICFVSPWERIPIHTASDTIDLIDPVALAQSTQTLGEVVETLRRSR